MLRRRRWMGGNRELHNGVIRNLEEYARVSIDWAERWELKFDTANTKAVHFSWRRGLRKLLRLMLTAKIKVGSSFIKFDRKATRYLWVWIDDHPMFKDHYNRCMKKARVSEAGLRSFTETHSVLPACVRPVQIASVQAITQYRSSVCNGSRFGPSKWFSSVPEQSKNPTCIPSAGFTGTGHTKVGL